MVCRASALTIYRPAVKNNTATPRGDESEWGAAVKTVSTLNRRVLSYAPAMAAQMLEYKAKEIGIPVQIIEDAAPEIAVGQDLTTVSKAVRKARRKLKEHKEHDHHQNA